VLLQIGKRTTEPDVVELLRECHDRIRKFLVMARRLATATDASADEIREVASQIRRYFVESLPLHMADEEDEIVPRLVGRNGEVDRALAAMADDHARHEPLVSRLVELCAVLIAEPGLLVARADELGAIATQLATDFTTHLETEERVIFPALRQLPSEARAAVLAAMRARRERMLG
jgi:iron-sulfur cluster repair protein YtfE (RIC family)